MNSPLVNARVCVRVGVGCMSYYATYRMFSTHRIHSLFALIPHYHGLSCSVCSVFPARRSSGGRAQAGGQKTTNSRWVRRGATCVSVDEKSGWKELKYAAITGVKIPHKWGEILGWKSEARTKGEGGKKRREFKSTAAQDQKRVSFTSQISTLWYISSYLFFVYFSPTGVLWHQVVSAVVRCMSWCFWLTDWTWN